MRPAGRVASHCYFSSSIYSSIYSSFPGAAAHRPGARLSSRSRKPPGPRPRASRLSEGGRFPGGSLAPTLRSTRRRRRLRRWDRLVPCRATREGRAGRARRPPPVREGRSGRPPGPRPRASRLSGRPENGWTGLSAFGKTGLPLSGQSSPVIVNHVPSPAIIASKWTRSRPGNPSLSPWAELLPLRGQAAATTGIVVPLAVIPPGSRGKKGRAKGMRLGAWERDGRNGEGGRWERGRRE